MRLTRMVCLAIVMLLALGCGDDDDGVTEPANTNPEGRLYVLNQADATLYVYDTRTMTRVDSVFTHVANPHYIDFSPDGDHFYIIPLIAQVPNFFGKFDADSNFFIDSAAIPPAVLPSAIAITADGKFGWVCNFNNQDDITRLLKYDLDSMVLVDSAQAGARTHDLKITSDGAWLVACNSNTDDLTLIELSTGNVSRVEVGPNPGIGTGANYGPWGVAIDHRDSLAFISCMWSKDVRILDIAAGVILDSIPVPVDSAGLVPGPTLLVVSPDDKVVFVTTQNGNSVVAIDVSTKDTLADIPLGIPNPFGITMSDDGSRVYVACINTPGSQGWVYSIDGNSYAKVDSIAVGTNSFGLIWRPLTQ